MMLDADGATRSLGPNQGWIQTVQGRSRGGSGLGRVETGADPDWVGWRQGRIQLGLGGDRGRSRLGRVETGADLDLVGWSQGWIQIG